MKSRSDPVRRGEFVLGVLEMEEIAVGHVDEQIELGGIIVEDPCFGQPDAVGDHLQADSLVILRHKELQGILQNLFPIGFHGLNIFIYHSKILSLFGKMAMFFH